MTPQRKRIETTLLNLVARSTPSPTATPVVTAAPAGGTVALGKVRDRPGPVSPGSVSPGPVSFDVRSPWASQASSVPQAVPRPAPHAASPPPPNTSQPPSAPAGPQIEAPALARTGGRPPVPPSPTMTTPGEAARPQPVGRGHILLDDLPTPILPKVKPTNFTSHRNAVNPGLALGLLKQMETITSQWQVELSQIVRQIHDLYAAGPIVNGWLESYTQGAPPSSELSHADPDHLAEFVEQKWRESPQGTPDPLDGAKSLDGTPSATPSGPTPGSALDAAGYRLCGLQDDGQLWMRHCPASQVPTVSLAIARYQTLRQLLIRKQRLENDLGRLSERLITLHSDMQSDAHSDTPKASHSASHR
jgi:hypothetical protein